MKTNTLSKGGFSDNRNVQIPKTVRPLTTEEFAAIFSEGKRTRKWSASSLDCTDTNHRIYAHYKSNHKIIKSGHVIEVYEYQYPVYLGEDKTKGSNPKRSRENREEEYKLRRGTRALNNIRRVALSNFSQKDKFLTLTFRENLKDIEVANKELDKFLKRLRRRHPELKYISAVQFQKRGAIHYHLLINLPYVKQRELQELWGNGFIDIRKLNNVDNVGAYISRYIIRDAQDKRLKGKKSYSTSKGLKRPVSEYLTEYGFHKFKSENNLDLHPPVYTNTYKSDWNGTVIYKEYNLSRHLNSSKKFR
jgi:hypothetical protein